MAEENRGRRIDGTAFGDQKEFRERQKEKDDTKKTIKEQTDSIVGAITALQAGLSNLLLDNINEVRQTLSDQRYDDVIIRSDTSEYLRAIADNTEKIYNAVRNFTNSSKTKAVATKLNVGDTLNIDVDEQIQKNINKVTGSLSSMIKELGELDPKTIDALKLRFGKSKLTRMVELYVKNIEKINKILDKHGGLDNVEKNKKRLKAIAESGEYLRLISSEITEITTNISKASLSVLPVTLGVAAMAVITPLIWVYIGLISTIAAVDSLLKPNLERLQGLAKTTEDIGKSMMWVAGSIVAIGAAAIIIGWEARKVYEALSKEHAQEGLMQILGITGVSLLILTAVAGISNITDSDSLMTTALALPLMMGGIATASLLIAWVSTVIANRQDDIQTGLAVMTMITLGAGALLVGLSFIDKMNKESNIMTTALVLPAMISGIGLSCLLLAAIAQKLSSMDNIAEGLILMGVITAAGIGVIYLLSKIAGNPASIMKIIIGIGLFTVALLAVTGVIYTMTLLAQYIVKNSKTIWRGLGEMAGILLAAGASIIAIGAGITAAAVVIVPALAAMIIFQVALLGVTALLAAFVGMTILTDRLIQKGGGTDAIKAMSANQIQILLSYVDNISAAGEYISSNVIGLLKGIVTVPMVSLFGLLTSTLILTMIVALRKSQEQIDAIGGADAVKDIFGIQMSLINTFVDSAIEMTDNIGIGKLAKTMVKMAEARIVITDLLGAISSILDTIEKMGNLKVIDTINPDGTVIYKQLQLTVSSVAEQSKILAEMTTTFLNNLLDDSSVLLSNIDKFKDNAKIVVDALLGGERWYTKIFGGQSRSKGILDIVSEIMLMIEKMSSLKVITGYDNNGEPIYASISDPTTFETGAIALASCITGFLSTLADELKGKLSEDLLDNFADAVVILMGGTKTDVKGGLLGLIVGGSVNYTNVKGGMIGAVSGIIEVIEKASKLGEGVDFRALGANTAGAIVGFLNALTENLNGAIDKKTQKQFKETIKLLSGEDGTLASLSPIFDMMNKTKNISNIRKVAGEAGAAFNLFVKELYKPITYDNKGKLKDDQIIDMVTAYKVTADSIGNSIEKVNKIIDNSIKSMDTDKLTKKFNELTLAVKDFNEELNNTNKNIETLADNSGNVTVPVYKTQDVSQPSSSQTSTNTSYTSQTSTETQNNPVIVRTGNGTVALDGQTLDIFRMMFEALGEQLGNISNMQSNKDIFVSIDNNILKGKLMY